MIVVLIVTPVLNGGVIITVMVIITAADYGGQNGHPEEVNGDDNGEGGGILRK